MVQEPASLPSVPIFSHHVEAKAMEALNVVILVHGGDGSPIQPDQLVQLEAAVADIVDCLFPLVGDSAEFSGSDSLDGNDYIHPVKVASLAAVVGRRLGMARSAIIDAATAAMLMNVGYLALRRSLIDEPRRLLEGEWERHVHTHPDRSIAMLAQSGLHERTVRTIAQHHERWDGSGYPAGLRGDDICLEARILAVADTYVSLRSIRPYRPAVDMSAALAEIAGASERLFDPTVVEAFEEVIAEYAGIMRPECATAERALAGPSIQEEAPRAPRDERADDLERYEASVRQADRDEDAERERREAHERQRITRRAAPAAVTPALPATVRPLPPTADPAPLPAPIPPSRRRRPAHAPRRRLASQGGRRATLFSPALYVDAAIRGRWAD